MFYFVPPAGFSDDEELAGYGYNLGMAVFDDVLNRALIEQQLGGYFKEGRFLVDNFFVGVVEGFDDFYLLFYLPEDAFYPCFGGVYHDDEFVDVFYLAAGGGEAFYIDVPPEENTGEAVEQPHVVFGIDGEGVGFVFFHGFSDGAKIGGSFGAALFFREVSLKSMRRIGV